MQPMTTATPPRGGRSYPLEAVMSMEPAKQIGSPGTLVRSVLTGRMSPPRRAPAAQSAKAFSDTLVVRAPGWGELEGKYGRGGTIRGWPTWWRNGHCVIFTDEHGAWAVTDGGPHSVDISEACISAGDGHALPHHGNPPTAMRSWMSFTDGVWRSDPTVAILPGEDRQDAELRRRTGEQEKLIATLQQKLEETEQKKQEELERARKETEEGVAALQRQLEEMKQEREREKEEERAAIKAREEETAAIKAREEETAAIKAREEEEEKERAAVKRTAAAFLMPTPGIQPPQLPPQLPVSVPRTSPPPPAVPDFIAPTPVTPPPLTPTYSLHSFTPSAAPTQLPSSLPVYLRIQPPPPSATVMLKMQKGHPFSRLLTARGLRGVISDLCSTPERAAKELLLVHEQSGGVFGFDTTPRDQGVSGEPKHPVPLLLKVARAAAPQDDMKQRVRVMASPPPTPEELLQRGRSPGRSPTRRSYASYPASSTIRERSPPPKQLSKEYWDAGGSPVMASLHDDELPVLNDSDDEGGRPSLPNLSRGDSPLLSSPSKPAVASHVVLPTVPVLSPSKTPSTKPQKQSGRVKTSHPHKGDGPASVHRPLQP